MEPTKTTEKFTSVHKTFSYTPQSALTNQWSNSVSYTHLTLPTNSRV